MTTNSKGSCDVKIYLLTQTMKRDVCAMMQKYYFVSYPYIFTWSQYYQNVPVIYVRFIISSMIYVLTEPFKLVQNYQGCDRFMIYSQAQALFSKKKAQTYFGPQILYSRSSTTCFQNPSTWACRPSRYGEALQSGNMM